jgi:hypothetical protein
MLRVKAIDPRGLKSREAFYHGIDETAAPR